MQDVHGEPQSRVQQMFCIYCSCRCRSALPVDARLPGNQRGDIGNPGEPFPEMLCTMNADQYEFVFHRQGGSFIRIEAHVNLPREEIFDGQRTRKISQRELAVQFDEQLRIRLGEKILARNFALIDCAERNSGFVA